MVPEINYWAVLIATASTLIVGTVLSIPTLVLIVSLLD